jgi:hypothetical protein
MPKLLGRTSIWPEFDPWSLHFVFVSFIMALHFIYVQQKKNSFNDSSFQKKCMWLLIKWYKFFIMGGPVWG